MDSVEIPETINCFYTRRNISVSSKASSQTLLCVMTAILSSWKDKAPYTCIWQVHVTRKCNRKRSLLTNGSSKKSQTNRLNYLFNLSIEKSNNKHFASHTHAHARTHAHTHAHTHARAQRERFDCKTKTLSFRWAKYQYNDKTKKATGGFLRSQSLLSHTVDVSSCQQ